MDRKQFIRLSGLSAMFAAFSPGLYASSLTSTFNKPVLFVVLSGGVRVKDFKKAWKDPEDVNSTFQINEVVETSHRDGHQRLAGLLGNCFEIRADHATSDWLKPFQTGKNNEKIYLVIIDGFDCAHHDIQQYYQKLNSAAKMIHRRWIDFASANPGGRLIITTDIGRNNYFNDHGGLDHDHFSAREVFRYEAQGPNKLL